MSLENVKYDAFISYRHSDLDMFTAMSIQRKLENFKLPRSLHGKTSGRTKIERVFRDQDELPLSSNLSDPIEEALQNSDFLIVICTPRLPESLWCAKEIDTFIQLHGREHVLAVLAEGEPEESFSENLRYVKKLTLDELGNETEEIVEIEPLAADARGNTLKERKKMIDDAVLRLAAPLFGLNYDDLKQRHKEQRTRRILTVASIVAAFFFVFALVCMGLAIRINSQKSTIAKQFHEIEAKNMEIEANNMEILKQSAEIIKKNEEISRQYRAEQLKYAETMADSSKALLTNGRRFDALYAVRNAMPDTKDSVDIPYSAASERALTDALGVYNRDDTLAPMFSYELLSNPERIAVSPDGKLLAAMDKLGYLYVFDTITGKETERFSLTKAQSTITDITWVTDTAFVYCDQKELHAYDATDKRNTRIGEKEGAIDAYVISHDLKTIYTSVYISSESRIRVDVYSVEKNYEKTDSLYVDNQPLLQNIFGGFIREMDINETGSHLSFLMKKESSYSSFTDYSPYILSVMNLTDNTAFSTEISLKTYSTSMISNDSFIVLSIYSPDGSFLVYDTEIDSYSLTDGKLKWTKAYSSILLDNITLAKPDGRDVLILDGSGVIVVLDAQTGEEAGLITHDSSVCKSLFPNNGTSNARIIVMANGRIYYQIISQNLLLDYTGKWYKYIPDKVVALCDVTKNYKFFFCYLKENYITEFDITINDNITESEMFSPFDTGKGTYVFSDDYRYAVVTLQTGTDYRHALCDMINRSVLCEVTDKLMFGGFLPNDTGRFYTYANGCKLYSASGELLKSAGQEVVGSIYFSSRSVNGKYLVFWASYSKSAVVFSPEEGEIIATITPDFPIRSAHVDDIADRIFIVGDEKICSYKLSNPSVETASLKVDFNIGYNTLLSTDGRYLFSVNQNETVNIYDAETLTLAKTIYYNTAYTMNEIKYLPTEKEYLIVSNSLAQNILSDTLESKKIIYDCLGYDAEKKAYVIKLDDSLGYINNFSYEELIRQCDELLGDYEPSAFTKDKYHIN